MVENRKQWFFASANCSTLDCQLHSRELLYYLHMYTNVVVCSVHTQSYNRIKVFRKINPDDSLRRIYAKDTARDTNFFSNFCYPIKKEVTARFIFFICNSQTRIFGREDILYCNLAEFLKWIQECLLIL